MTNLEALKATIGFNIDTTDTMATKAMIDHGINAADEYALANRPEVDKAAIDLLVAMKQIKKVSDNGTSIEFDHASAEATIAFLCARNGIANPIGVPGPTINSVSIW